MLHISIILNRFTMNWKSQLDRFLTTEPHDVYSSWAETVLITGISDDFYDRHEDWLSDSSGQFHTWLTKLYRTHKHYPIKAAQIIERAHNRYVAK